MKDTKTEAAKFREAASEHGKRVEAAIDQLCKAVKRNARDCGAAIRVAKDDIRKLTICARPAPAPSDLVARAKAWVDENPDKAIGIHAVKPARQIVRDLATSAPVAVQPKITTGRMKLHDRLDAQFPLLADFERAVDGMLMPAGHPDHPVAVQVPAELEDFASRALSNAESVDRDSRPNSLHGWAGTVERLARGITDLARAQRAASAGEPAPWSCDTCEDSGAIETTGPTGEFADRCQEPCPDCASEPAPEPGIEDPSAFEMDLSPPKVVGTFTAERDTIAPPEPISDEVKARVVESAEGQRQRADWPSAEDECPDPTEAAATSGSQTSGTSAEGSMATSSKSSAGLLQAAEAVCAYYADNTNMDRLPALNKRLEALRAAIAAEEERGAEDPKTVECDSCKGDIDLYADKSREDHVCGKCKIVVCQSCCDVFGHFGDGPHGGGDPAEAVDQMRKELEENEASLKRALAGVARQRERAEKAEAELERINEDGHAGSTLAAAELANARASGDAKLRELQEWIYNDPALREYEDAPSMAPCAGLISMEIDRVLADPDKKHTSVDSGGGVDQPAAERGEDVEYDPPDDSILVRWLDSDDASVFGMLDAVNELCRRELERGGSK